MNRVLLTAARACVVTHAAIAPAEGLPVGRWEVEFANGVVEMCEIGGDGTASVVEPRRSAGGTAVSKEGTVVITFDDDRVERWTPVGSRMVVEHWYPAAGFPCEGAVLGIADRAATVEAGSEPGDLSARVRELESRNAILRAEAVRLNLQLLKSLEQRLRTDPGDRGAQREATRLASQLAPDLPGNPIVWRVLVATGTLKDGMPLADAEKLLGPPTTTSDEHVEWYFNPRGRRAAPCLRADVTEQGLAGWKLGRR